MSWTDNPHALIPDGEYLAAIVEFEPSEGDGERFFPHVRVKWELIDSGRFVFEFLSMPHWALDPALSKKRSTVLRHWLSRIGRDVDTEHFTEESWKILAEEIVTADERYLVKVRTNDWSGCVRNWVKGMRLVP